MDDCYTKTVSHCAAAREVTELIRKRQGLRCLVPPPMFPAGAHSTQRAARSDQANREGSAGVYVMVGLEFVATPVGPPTHGKYRKAGCEHGRQKAPAEGQVDRPAVLPRLGLGLSCSRGGQGAPRVKRSLGRRSVLLGLSLAISCAGDPVAGTEPVKTGAAMPPRY